jgi:hypothetical protein
MPLYSPSISFLTLCLKTHSLPPPISVFSGILLFRVHGWTGNAGRFLKKAGFLSFPADGYGLIGKSAFWTGIFGSATQAISGVHGPSAFLIEG